jgi:hypothetical protein
VDAVVAQHPEVEAPKDRVVNRKILAQEKHAGRIGWPKGELRVAKQYCDGEDEQELVDLLVQTSYVKDGARSILVKSLR